MKNMEHKRFKKADAARIAQASFDLVLDSVSGVSDPDYTVCTRATDVYTNIEEDIEAAGFTVTEHRFDMVANVFDRKMERLEKSIKKTVQKLYTKST